MERRERVGATRLTFLKLIESELEVEENAVTCGANGRVFFFRELPKAHDRSERGVFREQRQRRWSGWRAASGSPIHVRGDACVEVVFGQLLTVGIPGRLLPVRGEFTLAQAKGVPVL